MRELLDRIEQQVVKDEQLSTSQREDFLVDVDNIRVQIRKNEPNVQIISILIEDLGNVQSCADLISGLHDSMTADLALFADN